MDAQLISRLPFFHHLPAEQIDTLMNTLKVVTYAAPASLFHEGEVGDRMYIVLDGQVAIVKALGSADERLLGLRGVGEFVGEMSLLSEDRLRMASACVHQDAQLLEVRRVDFEALMEHAPQLAYRMMRVMSDRLRYSQNAAVRDLHERNERLAQAYADLQAAQAQLIEKEALERELGVAREIQQSMLPRQLPRLPGYDLGALMVPAHEVAGDFFDIIPLEDGRLGVAVGDVCGKGVPAALFMALTRALLRAEVSHTAAPEQVLRRLNQQLPELSSSGLFVTMIYGVFDPIGGTFAYVRAGHELPLCWDAASEPLHVPRGLGHPLGLLPEPALDAQIITVPPGGALLLITDGVSEATDASGDLFGLQRIGAGLGEPGTTAQGRCARLLHTLTTYRGAVPQSDDITLLLIQRNPA